MIRSSVEPAVEYHANPSHPAQYGNLCQITCFLTGIHRASNIPLVEDVVGAHHDPDDPGVEPIDPGRQTPEVLDTTQQQLHERWHVRCVLLLVALLHTQYRVSFRACGLILAGLNHIFTALHLIGSEKMPVTLPTVFARLGLKDDRFTLYLACYQCHQLFDRNLPFDTLCPECQIALFQPARRQLFESVVSTTTGGSTPDRKPHLVAPIQLLSDGLRDFFQRPGMVPAVNLWKRRPHTPGESRTIQDGHVWSTIKGSDGQSFFYGESSENEIRIGTTFGLDWYVPP